MLRWGTIIQEEGRGRGKVNSGYWYFSQWDSWDCEPPVGKTNVIYMRQDLVRFSVIEWFSKSIFLHMDPKESNRQNFNQWVGGWACDPCTKSNIEHRGIIEWASTQLIPSAS